MVQLNKLGDNARNIIKALEGLGGYIRLGTYGATRAERAAAAALEDGLPMLTEDSSSVFQSDLPHEGRFAPHACVVQMDWKTHKRSRGRRYLVTTTGYDFRFVLVTNGKVQKIDQINLAEADAMLLSIAEVSLEEEVYKVSIVDQLLQVVSRLQEKIRKRRQEAADAGKPPAQLELAMYKSYIATIEVYADALKNGAAVNEDLFQRGEALKVLAALEESELYDKIVRDSNVLREKEEEKAPARRGPADALAGMIVLDPSNRSETD